MKGLDELATQLALRYRAGERAVLADLHAVVSVFVGAALRRYASAEALPPALERSDLEQESWLVLFDLLARWDPTAGPFGAFVWSFGPWRLGELVRRNTPGRRSARVTWEQLDDQVEQACFESGEDLVDHAAFGETLAQLPAGERAVLELHFADGLPLYAIAECFGVSRWLIQRSYRSGLATLRAGAESDPVAPLRDGLSAREARESGVRSRESGMVKAPAPDSRLLAPRGTQ